MSAPARFDLGGMIALFTGASRGLGRTIALKLAWAGAEVAITSRTLAALNDTKCAAGDLGRRDLPLEFAERAEASTFTAVTAVQGHFGRFDILRHNARRNTRLPAHDVFRQRTMSPAADREAPRVMVNCLLPGWFKTAQVAGIHADAVRVKGLSAKLPLRCPGYPDDQDGTHGSLRARPATTSRANCGRWEMASRAGTPGRCWFKN